MNSRGECFVGENEHQSHLAATENGDPSIHCFQWQPKVVVFLIPSTRLLTAYVFYILKKAVAGIKRINLDGLRWKVFDAKGQVLGRLASQLSIVLQGKDKPTYAPNRDDGDMCIVVNAKDIAVTGRKMTDKIYYRHTGQVSTFIKLLASVNLLYIGHLKERTLKEQMAKDPTEVIRKAVLRMLPRNKLRDDRDLKLRIFADGEHPFHDRPVEPYVMPPRTVRELRPRVRRAMVRAEKKAEMQAQGGSNTRKYRKKEAEAEETA
ncbi:50S ribosomal protein L13 [Linum perenne]